MNLQRGFYRLTLVTSFAFGVAALFLTPRPQLEEYRWRKPTAQELANALAWKATPGRKFDPDFYLMLGPDGKVLKAHQKLVGCEFFCLYYLAPFLLGFMGIWIAYYMLCYVVFGFHGGSENSIKVTR